MRRTIWISAGEASGDMHGASLMRAFKDMGCNLTYAGMGGEAMRREGLQGGFDAHDVALVGVAEVAAHLPRIGRMLAATWRALRRAKPAAVVCIDIPDFNFLVARMAHALGVPAYFYVSPQVWAWRTGRVRFLARHARRIFCILPFEVEFYARHGVAAEFVGHPLLDVMDLPAHDAIAPQPLRLGLLPGSRRREVATLLPAFAQAARGLAAELPGLSVCCIRAPGMDEALLRPHLEGLAVDMAAPDERYPAMRRCAALLAASGTVTLEAALLGTPAVVAYSVHPVTYALGRLLIDVPFMSLPNLILGRQVFPELLQRQVTPQRLMALARPWLADPPARAATLHQLAELRRLLGAPGAARRTAERIWRDMAEVAG